MKLGIQKQKSTAGFSLVELLIVIMIFVTLSTMLMADHNKMQSRIAVDSKAYEIGQWVREAQVYAMGVKSAASVASTAFVTGYGVHFATSDTGGFILFADRSATPDHVYDATGTCGSDTAECSKQIILPQGLKIEAIRAVDASNNLITLSSLDITFLRPNPDAFIRGNGSTVTQYSKAEIAIISPKGYRKTVDVWSTGQISVR